MVTTKERVILGIGRDRRIIEGRLITIGMRVRVVYTIK